MSGHRREQATTAEVMAAYAGLPSDQLISDAMVYTHKEGDELRWAAAAVPGYTRGGLYLDSARNLIAHILADAHEVSWRMPAYDVVRAAVEGRRVYDLAAHLQIVEAVNHREGALYLQQVAEVLWHFYAVSLHRAWYFMENSARIVDPGFTRTPTEKDWVETIRTFRNHMEHRDKAVRDISSRDWRSMSHETRDAFVVGYRLDAARNVFYVPSDGRWKGQERRMPVNQAGFDQAAEIVQGMHLRIRETCLQRLERQFTSHPETMPPIDQVGTTMSDVMEPIEDEAR